MAKIEIRFINFDRSEALETFVEKHLGSLLKRYEKQTGGPHKIEVHFKLDAKAPLGKLKNSEVLIAYKYPGTKKSIFVKKQSADLREALLECIHALSTSVQKITEKQESGRRTQGRSKKIMRLV